MVESDITVTSNSQELQSQSSAVRQAAWALSSKDTWHFCAS